MNPLIGNYGIALEDQESVKPYISGFIVNELSRIGSNFRKNIDLKDYLIQYKNYQYFKIIYYLYYKILLPKIW